MRYHTPNPEPLSQLTIQQKVVKQHGFVLSEDLPEIIEHDRLTPILVRCGGKRFTAPAQDVEAMIDLVSRDGKDYVRDASIPADYFKHWKNL